LQLLDEYFDWNKEVTKWLWLLFFVILLCTICKIRCIIVLSDWNGGMENGILYNQTTTKRD
jgi:ABC-type uncharacterized transport system fused permease/ATPase subunit